ncbi:MAG: YmaF family protein [Defluviitaleaceae bacterium]|nr:YmaF family protein [Defluviitaleaceae bacterium]
MYNYVKPNYYDLISEKRIEATNVNEDKRHQGSNEYHHTHEYAGGTELAGPTINLFHNHRFSGVTGDVIPLPDGNHAHHLEGVTDFTRGHFHTYKEETGPSIPVADGKHVHYIQGRSSFDSDHFHGFKFAAFINDPTGEQ